MELSGKGDVTAKSKKELTPFASTRYEMRESDGRTVNVKSTLAMAFLDGEDVEDR